ncbi:MAG: ABC transporter permease [Gorillibacterium sp.]|nr:ABC transporter permease [Gorillibacterium sp.]
MNGWTLLRRNIIHRKSLSLLTITAVAITVFLFVILLLVREGIERGAEKGYGPFEVVVGADGSESQLVLNTFYRAGTPTGNIPFSVMESIQQEQDVEVAFGLTVGDNYNGFPIVGIDPAYFPTRYQDRKLRDGKLYSSLGEVTIGYYVAKELHLRIGDEFYGAHGILGQGGEQLAAEEHEAESEQASGEEHPDEHVSFSYLVTGILPKLNTSDDRAIFTTMDYAWAVHQLEHDADKEVTAVIIKPNSLLATQSLKQKYDQLDNVQAVYTSKAVADILNMVDTGTELMTFVMAICVLLAAVTMVLSLTAAVQERKKDVGLLRLIGKSKSYILLNLVGEGVLLTALGLVLGILLGHLGGWALTDSLFTRTGIHIASGHFATGEATLLVVALAIGAAAAVIPALRIYRVDALSLFKQ